jgi:hypothetical protein
MTYLREIGYRKRVLRKTKPQAGTWGLLPPAATSKELVRKLEDFVPQPK